MKNIISTLFTILIVANQLVAQNVGISTNTTRFTA